MLRSAPPLLRPHQAVSLLTERPHTEEVFRRPAERVWLLAVWAGVVGFCLAFWAVVTFVLVR